MSEPVYYFIRMLARGSVLGPYDPIETLRRIRQLREQGIEYFVTDEAGAVLLSEEEIRRFEG